MEHPVLCCLFLSCSVLSCLVLSCLVLSCLVLSCLVLSCLVLSVMSRHVMSYHASSFQFLFFHGSPLYVCSGCAMMGHLVSLFFFFLPPRDAMSRYVRSNPCHSMPCHIIPCHVMPCHHLFKHILFVRPCPVMSSRVMSFLPIGAIPHQHTPPGAFSTYVCAVWPNIYQHHNMQHQAVMHWALLSQNKSQSKFK